VEAGKVALAKARRLIRAVKFDASDDADDGERRIVRPGAPQDLLAQRVFIRPMPSRKFLIHNDRLQPHPEPVSLIETAQVLFAESGSVVLFGEATTAQQRNPHCAELSGPAIVTSIEGACPGGGGGWPTTRKPLCQSFSPIGTRDVMLTS